MITYDYIIVGGGSAGCVLANRLSQDKDLSVLLIEAGKYPNKLSFDIPGLLGTEITSRDHNWFYYTEPQKQLKGQELFWPRGKALGGSSTINGMIYIRGHKADYDEWAALGCDGWSYEDVLPYFIKSEDSTRGESDYHGTGGPLYVGRNTSKNPINNCFLAAGEEAGYPLIDDFNGPTQEGFAPYDQTVKRGKRWSTAKAFLDSVIKKPNLLILTDAHVEKVLLDGKRASGVQVWRDGQSEKHLCSGEIIMCGGAINTPQILQLSGIGDPDDITPHNIEMKHTLKGVGKNLQDHLDVTVGALCKQPISLKKYMGLRAPLELLKWLIVRRGVLADIIAPMGAFIRTDSKLDRPDVQLHLIPALAEVPHGFQDPQRHGFSIHVCNLRPKSRGTIKLKSADPLAAPAIEPNYLSHSDDVRILRQGVRITYDLMREPSLQRMNAGYTKTWQNVDLMPDDELDTIIKGNAETIYHPVGTCAMGAVTDENAVVDPSLRVIGLKGLRVADASVMPRLIGGNTNAPTIMIAERCADFILNDLKGQAQLPL